MGERLRGLGARLASNAILCVGVLAALAAPAVAQPPGGRTGDAVPRDIRELYERGLKYLAGTQGEDGGWANSGQGGPGTVGMALMVFLASGEDPNFGLYSVNVRRALRNIITAQDSGTGIIGQSMYHHGFAMLALAEAYGAVDDRNLWPDRKDGRTIGQALELAVRGAITSQKKNEMGGWRYSPDATDAAYAWATSSPGCGSRTPCDHGPSPWRSVGSAWQRSCWA